MTASRRTEAIITFLRQDEIKNISMLRFMEGCRGLRLERLGDSILLRGKSDCRWVYISSSSLEELRQVEADRLTPDDTAFAAIEDWMLPTLTAESRLAWDLPVMRLVLPGDVALPGTPSASIAPLVPGDALCVYKHSIYRRLTSPAYIRARIRAGPSAGIRDGDKLAAWIMTHDDGSIGALHVLEAYRRRGYAYDLTLHMIAALRALGHVPFVNIEETNAKSMGLALKVGFRKDRKIHWFGIGPREAPSGPGGYCGSRTPRPDRV